MNKLVVLDLYGDLENGFNASLEIGCDRNYRPEIKIKAKLPPAKEVYKKYQNWHKSYHEIEGKALRIRPQKIQIKNINIESRTRECTDRASELVASFNDWLGAESFAAIELECLQQLKPEDRIRIIVSTSDEKVRKLPWNCWKLWQNYEGCEIALNSSSKSIKTRKEIQEERIRILAILGSDRGINLDTDRKELQELCGRSGAEIHFLVKPPKQKINEHLEDSRGWDVIFFSGHSSSSETEEKEGRLHINDREYLTIKEIQKSGQKAAAKRLKIAVFNSCDGLGIAAELEKLNIPQVIVMREAVPDFVAQEFLKHFLREFTTGISLYEAVNYARKKLQILEKQYPCASWLPAIVQNPLEKPPTWQNLGGIVSSPYQGLSAFTSENARFFFGREKFTAKLVNAVNNKPLVAVIGASGSGKSSVINAGLIPQLRQQQKNTWEIISLRPKNEPFAALALALLPLEQRSDPASQNLIRELELERQLHDKELALGKIITKILQQSDRTRMLLVIDQFEELFTLCETARWQFFIDSLLAAIASLKNLTVVLTLRADFYGTALAYPPFGKALEKYLHLPLIAMNGEELKQAISQPAKLTNVELEAGLSARIINSVKKQPGSLPLLEFTLTQLWSKQEDSLLTHQAYNQIGGVEKALANYAETIYEQISSSDRQKVRRIFMQLVQPGIETEDTRRIATKEQVKDWHLVRSLADRRLVVTSYNQITGVETVEIVHEALIRSWDRLKEWLEIDREFRKWQEHLRGAIERWENSGKDEDALLRGKSLIEAENWLERRSAELSAIERTFIKSSQKCRDDRRSRRKLSTRLTISGLSVGLIIAVGVASFAWKERRKAQLSEIQQITKSSEALFASNKKLEALVAAIKAKRKLQNLGVVDLNLEAEIRSLLQQAILNADEYNRLLGHSATVYKVAFSPDGKTIASASVDKTVKLWRSDGTLITTLTGHSDAVGIAVFSPDGKTIASASDDKTVKLWRSDGTLITTLTGHSNWVLGVSFSPDGKTIASASGDKTVKLWRTDGTLITTLTGHSDRVHNLAFSPDGKTIASASTDKTVKLWRTDGTLITTLTGHSGGVYSVAFSPDGKTIASASPDKTIKLWHSDGTLMTTLTGHNDTIYQVAFSPDGKTIASASADKTVKLWRTDGTLIATSIAYNDRVYGVAFSPDGKTIASASADKTVKLWRTDTNLITPSIAHGDRVYDVVFSHDGKTIASASGDKTVKLWHSDGTLMTTLIGHNDEVYRVAFSPDGKTIASASTDKTVKLWHGDGTLMTTLIGHSDWVYGVVFSPDGKTIASASADKTVKLWHSDGTLMTTLIGHSSWVYGVAFSPDGKTIASSSTDNKVKLWHSDGTLMTTLIGHNDGVYDVAFSPDGKTVASASRDNTVKLWRTDGTLIATLGDRDSGGFFRVAFSPNGKIVAASSWDNTIKLWNTNGTLITTLTRHSNGVLGVAFSPDGQTLASAGSDRQVILWNLSEILDLDELEYACNLVRDYLQTNPEVDDNDRSVCP